MIKYNNMNVITFSRILNVQIYIVSLSIVKTYPETSEGVHVAAMLNSLQLSVELVFTIE